MSDDGQQWLLLGGLCGRGGVQCLCGRGGGHLDNKEKDHCRGDNERAGGAVST